ncbi:MAG TPA: EthD domain-containing protein [Acetobacteraceae bacterium]|nr:EthD domain-containing protein [Acetobacteraceae bacterium]
MADPIYKVLIFLKRRNGMSIDEFRDYYENNHSKLCEKYAAGALRYFRRYVAPVANLETGESGELDFDVITELWFDNRTVFEKVLEIGSMVRLPAEVLADEMRLFDRTKTRYASVVEWESDLPRSST